MCVCVWGGGGGGICCNGDDLLLHAPSLPSILTLFFCWYNCLIKYKHFYVYDVHGLGVTCVR